MANEDYRVATSSSGVAWLNDRWAKEYEALALELAKAQDRIYELERQLAESRLESWANGGKYRCDEDKT